MSDNTTNAKIKPVLDREDIVLKQPMAIRQAKELVARKLARNEAEAIALLTVRGYDAMVRSGEINSPRPAVLAS